MVMKIHRLGRVSFRAIKSKRDYLRKGQSASWMYMSRLAAIKEYAFMKVCLFSQRALWSQANERGVGAVRAWVSRSKTYRPISTLPHHGAD
jgi:hypothetical protein